MTAQVFEDYTSEIYEQVSNLKPKSLENLTAVVSGASSGIGLATAILLASKGVSLRLLARREERLISVKDFIEKKFGVSVTYLAVDVTNPNFRSRLEASNVLESDIVINNAGLALGLNSVLASPEDETKKVMETNFFGVVTLTRAVLPYLYRKNTGHIVNVGSISSHSSYENGSGYCASKHALRAWHLAMRQELCSTGIQLSFIAPGMVETEFSEIRFGGDVARAKSVYQGFKPLKAIDIAKSILFSLEQPNHCTIDEVLLMPQAQGAPHKVHRVY